MTKPRHVGKASAWFICLLLAAGFHGLIAGWAQAQPVSFDTAKKSAAGLGAFRSAGGGDFNRDGNRDLAVITTPVPPSNSISVLLGNGDGTFQTAVDFPVGGTPTPLTANSIVVSYFNADSIQDLAVAKTDGRIAVLLGNGNGTFRAPLDSATGLPGAGPPGPVEGPTLRDYGDFNGDHLQDLAVTNVNTIAVLLGNGDGTFRTTPTFVGQFAVAGYFNDDGILDLCGGSVVYPGKGDGTFGPPITSPDVSVSGSITVGYFNNDAIADLVIGGGVFRSIAILLGNGDGTFRMGEFANLRAIDPLVGDFNGDTITDLAAADSNQNQVSIALGRGDGTFHTLAVSFPMGNSTLVGEFNGDGITDLASSDGDGVMVALGYGDGTFRGIRGYEVGLGAFLDIHRNSTVAPGEFNGDGIQDLAVAIPFLGSNDGLPGGISVLLGNGDGSFQWGFKFAAAGFPYAPLAVGEFNRDGIQDLVIASGGTVGVFLGNGNGTFQPVINFPTADNSSTLAIGYFNRDGFQDVAVVSNSGISVLLGNGDGTLQAPLFFDTGFPIPGPFVPKRSIAVSDFNGDGAEDLVSSNTPASSLSVLLGNGDGTFRAPLIFDAGGVGLSLAIGDFNSDRIQDLATTNNSPSLPGISVLIGNGNGTFGTPSFFSLGPGGAAGSIAVGDFNSDGIHDLAAASSSNVSILLGDGAGTFLPAVGLIISGFSNSIAIGQFNSDYRPDIVVSGFSISGTLHAHKISVLINDTP